MRQRNEENAEDAQINKKSMLHKVQEMDGPEKVREKQV